MSLSKLVRYTSVNLIEQSSALLNAAIPIYSTYHALTGLEANRAGAAAAQLESAPKQVASAALTELQQKWCVYWLLHAPLFCLERLLGPLLSRLPFYNTLKLFFLLYLISPKTNGAAQLYSCFLHPFLMRHEERIEQEIEKFQKRVELVAHWGKQKMWEELKRMCMKICVQITQIGSNSVRNGTAAAVATTSQHTSANNAKNARVSLLPPPVFPPSAAIATASQVQQKDDASATPQASNKAVIRIDLAPAVSNGNEMELQPSVSSNSSLLSIASGAGSNPLFSTLRQALSQQLSSHREELTELTSEVLTHIVEKGVSEVTHAAAVAVAGGVAAANTSLLGEMNEHLQVRQQKREDGGRREERGEHDNENLQLAESTSEFFSTSPKSSVSSRLPLLSPRRQQQQSIPSPGKQLLLGAGLSPIRPVLGDATNNHMMQQQQHVEFQSPVVKFSPSAGLANNPPVDFAQPPSSPSSRRNQSQQQLQQQAQQSIMEIHSELHNGSNHISRRMQQHIVY